MNATIATTHDRHCRSGCDRPPTTRVVMRSASGRIWVSYHCDDVTHAVPPHELEQMGLTPVDDDAVERLIAAIFGLPWTPGAES